MKPILFIALALALAACSLAAPQPTAPPEPTATPDYSAAVITLRRTACFGFCPVYKLTVYGDGRVEYDGEQYVDVTGRQTGQITPAQVQELVAAFEAANYFNLQDEYTVLVTDLPTTITSFAWNGQTKTVSNYGGCQADFEGHAPQALCDLEAKIDLVTNSAQWVGTP